jgi:hypothetical protein
VHEADEPNALVDFLAQRRARRYTPFRRSVIPRPDGYGSLYGVIKQDQDIAEGSLGRRVTVVQGYLSDRTIAPILVSTGRLPVCGPRETFGFGTHTVVLPLRRAVTA